MSYKVMSDRQARRCKVVNTPVVIEIVPQERRSEA